MEKKRSDNFDKVASGRFNESKQQAHNPEHDQLRDMSTDCCGQTFNSATTGSSMKLSINSGHKETYLTIQFLTHRGRLTSQMYFAETEQTHLDAQ